MRLVIASELLAIDFYGKALGTKQFTGSSAVVLRRALANERAHYTALAQVLQSAGQTPAVADDIDFTYPRGSFASRKSITKLGARLQPMFVGIAVGAAARLQSESLRLPVAQIAASEAQHSGALSGAAGSAFPAALTVDQASTALEAFES